MRCTREFDGPDTGPLTWPVRFTDGTSAADIVVVGRRIAGLLAATRLAAGGARVTLLERGALGSGASVSNHGIVHSGALYVRHHPSVLHPCQRAQAMVQAEFPDAAIGVFPAIYFGQPDRVSAVAHELSRRGLGWKPARPPALVRQAPESAAGMGTLVVKETIVSSRQVLVELVTRAGALRVRILPWTAATDLDQHRGRWLVGLPGGRRLPSGTVVLAAGEGNRRLLARLAPRTADLIRSRLELMIYLPGYRPAAPMFCLDYGGPTLVPACGGALVSFHGAPRLDHDDRCGRPVPLGRATQLLHAATVFPGLADHAADAAAYTCVKTEWADEHADQWGSRPEHAVIDHAAHGLSGLLSLIPGKMTLAFQATRELAQLVLGGPVPLAPPRPRLSNSLTEAAAAQVAVEPWRAVPDPVVRAS